MKMVKKSNLIYERGYICTKKGKVVSVPNNIVRMMNKLDRDVQESEWRKEQPVPEPAKKFVPITERIHPIVKVDTPALDEQVERSMAIMEDIDAMAGADEVNQYLAEIDPLIQWVMADKIIATENPAQLQFDLPRLGNPLELDIEYLVDLVANMYVD